MTHPLHDNPRCRAEDLGEPIPDSPHAVSVCLPTWADIVGYEEKDPRVIGKMRTGYPRFFVHPLVNEVRTRLREHHGRAGEDVLPFPEAAWADECARFAGEGARVADVGGGVAAAFFPQDLLPRARAYWQHTGRILSSRAAEDWLATGRLQAPDAGLENLLRVRLAGWCGAPMEIVTLHPSGMAAIYAAFLASCERRPGRRTVMFGFPYTDTLKILQKFGNGVEFFPRGDAADLRSLENLLRREEIAGIFCEFPGNPLLQVPDLPALHAMAAAAGVPVIVDDTIGTSFNVAVLPHSDFVATSLTKAVSGEGDVMAGALAASLRGIFGANPPAPVPGNLYVRDAHVLEENSRDFPERMASANSTALALAKFLACHPAIKSVYYPCLNPAPAYEALRKPGGGYGAVVSFVPRNAPENSPRIYERLALNRGISLGTKYSLVCPYVQLAHYHELAWARDCGIDPFLLRVAVGTEPWPALRERFVGALG